MFEISLANLGVYCGQILVVVALAAMAACVFDAPQPRVRLVYWRAVVVLCVMLPLIALTQPAARSLSSLPLADTPPTSNGAGISFITSVSVPSVPLAIGSYVLTIILAGICFRLMWLAIGFVRLQGLRRSSRPVVLDQDLESLRGAIAAHAHICSHSSARQPATFGLRRPVILLPDSVALMSHARRRAIVCHELIHVRRRDWMWTILEEAARSVFWFHPAMRYAISRVQTSREEVVDAEVIARTGDRLAYMHALMSFARHPGFDTAASFVRRGQLSARLRRMTEEVHVSRLRARLTASALGAIVVAALAVAIGSLRYELAAQQPVGFAPLDAVQFSVPIARAIVRLDRPEYPLAAWRAGIGAEVLFTARIAPDGRVTIEGTPAWQITAIDTSPVEAIQEFWSREGWRDFLNAVANAVAQWQYVPAETEVFVQSRMTFARPPNQASLRLPDGVQPGPTSPLPPVRIGSSIPMPRRVSGGRPVYSQAALFAQVEGLVFLEVLVGVDGTVRDARVTNSQVPLLDQSALDAVVQWRFEPTLVNGVPRDVSFVVGINFSLRDGQR